MQPIFSPLKISFRILAAVSNTSKINYRPKMLAPVADVERGTMGSNELFKSYEKAVVWCATNDGTDMLSATITGGKRGVNE